MCSVDAMGANGTKQRAIRAGCAVCFALHLLLSNMPYPYPLQQMIADQLLPIFIFYALTCVVIRNCILFSSRKTGDLQNWFIINLVSANHLFGINPFRVPSNMTQSSLHIGI